MLGAIESGVDFEKRIAGIYQRCRRPEQIQAAFDQLQLELSLEINEAMTRTRQQLLENFDDEVREKLRVRDEASKAYLNRFERLLMLLARTELDGHAEFLSDSSFRLHSQLFAAQNGRIPLGLYELPRRSGEAHLFRLNHPLAEAILAQAKGRELATAEVFFDYSAHLGKISLLEPSLGRSGWLRLSQFTVESLDQSEDHLIFAAVHETGEPLADDAACRLFTVPGRIEKTDVSTPPTSVIDELARQRQDAIQRDISQRNAAFFEAEAQKLDGWADDLKLGLEREIKELDRQIKEARRAAITALTLEEKQAGQKQIRSLESLRNQKRRSLFEAQDEVDLQRDSLITQIEGKLEQKTSLSALFTIRWTLA